MIEKDREQLKNIIEQCGPGEPIEEYPMTPVALTATLVEIKASFSVPLEDVLDPCTGIKLTPSPGGRECLGNGTWLGYECCCDECDFFSTAITRTGRQPMKVSIKGDNVTPENIAAALAACERDHGLKIKGATVYLRLEDRLGRIVEPLQDGHEISREFTFRTLRPVKVPLAPRPRLSPEPVDPITAKEMIESCQRAARRVLSAPEMKALILLEQTKVERKVFQEALRKTMDSSGRFNLHTLERNVAAMQRT